MKKLITQSIVKDVYFVHHPEASNAVSELLVAGYEKFLEGSFGKALGVDNSTLQAMDIMQSYGKNDLDIGSHSRGTLTVSNALQLLDTEANRINKILAGTTIKMVGPAADATTADRYLSHLQTGEDRNDSNSSGSIRIENHGQDPVGGLIGRNPSTMNDNTHNRGFFHRMWDLFSGKSSMHSCYGLGNGQCVKDGYRVDNVMKHETTIWELNQKRKGGK